jgi:hypothetical protein
VKKAIIISVFLLSYFQLCAQSQSDSIEVRRGLGAVFSQNGKKLTPRQLLDITQANPEAYKEMKIAKSNYGVGNVFGFAGGLMVGWTLGTAMGGGQPNWTVAGVGAGLIGVSIPFSVAYTRHAKNAVRIYNDGLKQTGMNQVDLRLGMTGTGVGLRMAF